MSNFDDRHKLFTQTVINTESGTNARKLYDTSIQELNTLEANYDLLSELLNIDYVTDNLLDNLAVLVGTSRIPGESDADLKNKIITTALSKNSDGTAKNIIDIIKAFDSVNTYVLNENPESDTLYWDGKTTLDGLEAFNLYHPATFRVERDLLDTDITTFVLADFLFSAKTSGVNGSLYLTIDISQAVHYFEPPLIWDGLSILDGNTIMNENEVWNCERWDGETTLDGNGYILPYIGRYVVDNYKIFDTNNQIVKHEIYKDRFIGGIYVYSALLRESEGNGKFIKKIQFLNGATVNFEVTLNNPVLKKQGIRILFYEKNL
jgi:hypothetical protein